jgi:uncharacterized membrane protein YeaQ/YmgE (transglycosylase-associated protein family)
MLTIDGLGWFTWLVVGALAGGLASAVVGPRRQHRLLFGVVLGILAATLGGIIFSAVRFPAIAGFDAFRVASLFPAMTSFSGWSILVAFVAALALLSLVWLYSDLRATKLHR